MRPVAINTVPEAGITIRVVDDSTREGLAGQTLTVALKKFGGSLTTLVANTDYTIADQGGGYYDITFLLSALFDTPGDCVVEVTGANIDEYPERFHVFTPANAPATPATLSDVERASVADWVLTRTLINAIAATSRETWGTGDERWTLIGSILATAGKNVDEGGNLATYWHDLTTPAFSRPLTSNPNGVPISGVG